MTFLEAYAICTTVLAFLLALKNFKGPEDRPSGIAKAAGQGLFFLALVGICALAARGLVEIARVIP